MRFHFRETKERKRRRTKTDHLCRLPEDILLHTLRFLEYPDVWKLQPTCRRFRDVWLMRRKRRAALRSFSNIEDFNHCRMVSFNLITGLHTRCQFKEITLWAAFRICDLYVTSPSNEQFWTSVAAASLYIAFKFLEDPLRYHLFPNRKTMEFVTDILQTLGSEVMPKYGMVCNVARTLIDVATSEIESEKMCLKLEELTLYALEKVHISNPELLHPPILLAAACLWSAMRLIKLRPLYAAELMVWSAQEYLEYTFALDKIGWTLPLVEASGYIKRELRPLYKEIKRAVESIDLRNSEVILKYQYATTMAVASYFTGRGLI